MVTRWWNAVPEAGRAEVLREAAEFLRSGGIVAFPTETVYGLGGDARSDEAVARIFRAKGRPSDNPLIVHIADRSQLDGLVEAVPEPARRLMDVFWPGPLTLVLPAVKGSVSERVTAGLDTVAVRMPAHPIALAFLREAGCPVAAPSANRSGRPSPTTARHVLDDLDGRIDGVIDGGPTGVGLESTVAEITEEGAVRILRPGGVTRERIRALGLKVERDETPAASEAPPRSPGLKYAHYAPQGRMEVYVGEPPDRVLAHMQRRLDEAASRGERTAALVFAEHAGRIRADAVLNLGSRSDLGEAARRLYDRLRECDARGIRFIAAEGVPEEGIGEALMNRLRKAASGRVRRV